MVVENRGGFHSSPNSLGSSFRYLARRYLAGSHKGSRLVSNGDWDRTRV